MSSNDFPAKANILTIQSFRFAFLQPAHHCLFCIPPKQTDASLFEQENQFNNHEIKHFNTNVTGSTALTLRVTVQQEAFLSSSSLPVSMRDQCFLPLLPAPSPHTLPEITARCERQVFDSPQFKYYSTLYSTITK